MQPQSSATWPIISRFLPFCHKRHTCHKRGMKDPPSQVSQIFSVLPPYLSFQLPIRRRNFPFSLVFTGDVLNSMGLSSFPSSSEGLLSLLMVSMVVAITVLKRAARSLLGSGDSPSAVEEVDQAAIDKGRVVVTRFKSLYHSKNDAGGNQRVVTECCVCLCKFEAEEEVSELVSCRHFFHKVCLQKWFDNRGNNTISCPLCRSLL